MSEQKIKLTAVTVHHEGPLGKYAISFLGSNASITIVNLEPDSHDQSKNTERAAQTQRLMQGIVDLLGGGLFTVFGNAVPSVERPVKVGEVRVARDEIRVVHDVHLSADGKHYAVTGTEVPVAAPDPPVPANPFDKNPPTASTPLVVGAQQMEAKAQEVLPIIPTSPAAKPVEKTVTVDVGVIAPPPKRSRSKAGGTIGPVKAEQPKTNHTVEATAVPAVTAPTVPTPTLVPTATKPTPANPDDPWELNGKGASQEDEKDAEDVQILALGVVYKVNRAKLQSAPKMWDAMQVLMEAGVRTIKGLSEAVVSARHYCDALLRITDPAEIPSRVERALMGRGVVLPET